MIRYPKFLLTGFILWVLFYIFIEKFDITWWVLAIVPAFLAAVIVWLFHRTLQKRKFSQLFFVGFFLLIISLPLVGRKQETSLEKRKLTEFPAMRISNVWEFFFQFQNYFNDRFAFRSQSVEAISRFRLDFFGVSSMPHLVEVGKNGWLFTSKSDQIQNTATPFTDEELDAVERNLEMITRYLDQYGIKYYFAIIPTKEHIYQEQMHELLKRRMRFSKADQLNNRLRNNPIIRTIYVKDVLMEGKSVRDTYSSIDTHWNQYGCFLAYRKVVARISQDFPGIQGADHNDFDIVTTRTDEGDLQFLMGFRKKYFFDHYRYVPKNGVEPFEVDSVYPEVPASWNYAVMKMPGNNSGLKLVMIRDSFGEFMKLFLSRDFENTELIWNPVVPIGKVLSVKPDVVYQQLAEPLVMHALKLPEEIAADTVFLKKYYPEYLNLNH